MKDYTQCLIETYGEDATILTSTINGRKSNGDFFSDQYTSTLGVLNAAPMTRSATQPACSPTELIDRVISGAYIYQWCRSTTPNFEATRDVYYNQNGRITFLKWRDYDCEVALDLATMTTTVKLAVCPI